MSTNATTTTATTTTTPASSNAPARQSWPLTDPTGSVRHVEGNFGTQYSAGSIRWSAKAARLPEHNARLRVAIWGIVAQNKDALPEALRISNILDGHLRTKGEQDDPIPDAQADEIVDAIERMAANAGDLALVSVMPKQGDELEEAGIVAVIDGLTAKKLSRGLTKLRKRLRDFRAAAGSQDQRSRSRSRSQSRGREQRRSNSASSAASSVGSRVPDGDRVARFVPGAAVPNGEAARSVQLRSILTSNKSWYGIQTGMPATATSVAAVNVLSPWQSGYRGGVSSVDTAVTKRYADKLKSAIKEFAQRRHSTRAWKRIDEAVLPLFLEGPDLLEIGDIEGYEALFKRAIQALTYKYPPKK